MTGRETTGSYTLYMLLSNQTRSDFSRNITNGIPRWLPQYKYEHGSVDLKGNMRRIVYSYAPDWSVASLLNLYIWSNKLCVRAITLIIT